VLAFLLVAPFFEGVSRRINARVQSRQGPPLVQPYYDLFKLLGKQNFVSDNVIFKAAPALAFGAVVSVICLIPAGHRGGVFTPYGDIIAVIYLLTFSGVAILLGAMASGNTYAVLGLSREMITMIMIEPVLAMTFIMGGVRAGDLSLAGAFDGIMNTGFNISSFVMLAVFVLAFQAFAGVQPFDISEAEIEILEGPYIEYSGPGYALFRYTIMVKRMTYAAIFTGVFLPFLTTGYYGIDLLIQLGEVLVIYSIIALTGATNPRLRIDQAVKYYAFLIACSLGAVIMSAYGL